MTLNHVDLVAKGIPVVFGINRQYYSHGTAVLGIVVAEDNEIGGIGIAPRVNSARVISIWRSALDNNPRRADAVAAAISVLSPGDVLLIEDQLPTPTRYLPVEAEEAIFQAILAASKAGIIVIEPAGNGNADLDTITDSDGCYFMKRPICSNGPNDCFKDSGAIMVAAGTPTWPHDRALSPCNSAIGSSYGTRIDCYAWGNEIDTCGTQTPSCGSPSPPDLPDTTGYDTNFGGTSGASAIIAGAALCLQGIAKSLSPALLLSPLQMRIALSNPLTGTTSRNGACIDKIGVMPDLFAIARAMGFAPDVYIRDNPMDNGEPSVTGPLSASPDIIVLPTAVADPVASFGQGSGTENALNLGSVVQGNQDNFVYVRLKNRGVRNLQNVSVTVYWSEVASLVTPNMWHPIGTINVPDVPAGNILVVGGPLIWPARNIPGAGHYCFIGVVDHYLDPSPSSSLLSDFAEFEAYIRNNNNVAWRNFNVIENTSPSWVPARFRGFLPLTFMMVGAPDKRRKFNIEITRDLPLNSSLILEAPEFFPGMLRAPENWVEFDKETGYRLISLPHLNKIKFDGVSLDAHVHHRCTLWVNIGDIGDGLWKNRYQYQVTLSQKYNNTRVGTITWVISNPQKEVLPVRSAKAGYRLRMRGERQQGSKASKGRPVKQLVG
jgi:serine protease